MKNYLLYLKANKIFDIPEYRGRRKKRETQYATPKEIYRFISEVDLQTGLAILLMFEGGLRVSEMLSVKWADIDFNKNRIKVLKGKGNKFREVIFSEFTKELLYKYSEYCESENLFTFTRQNWYYKLYEKSKEKLGIKITPHMLRHSCGFYLRSQGWQLDEIQQYLGHEDLSTTSIYTHLDKDKVLTSARGIFDNAR